MSGDEQIEHTRVTVSSLETGEKPALPDLSGTLFLGHYQILSLLGQGGMSVVYKARNIMLDQTCAIKMLHQHLLNNELALRRFRQEAQSAAKLQHEGIVTVHDFGVTDSGQPYLVMDCVQGRSLAEVVDEGPVSPDRALRLIAQICAALALAHKSGVVHRDIKPSNVILLAEGCENERIKVVDFGIAKVIDSEHNGLTQTGEALGSPPYMSPEQCSGRALDARSDIYSTGCLLFELITGQQPFRGGSVFETIHMQMMELPPPVSKLRPGLANADQIDGLILKAMAKNPDERFQSADEFLSSAAKLAGSINTASGIMPALKARADVTAKRLRKRSGLFWLQTAAAILVPICVAAFAFLAIHNQDARSPSNKEDALTHFRRCYEAGCNALNADNYKDAEGKFNDALTSESAVGQQDEEFRDCLRKLAQSYRSDGKPDLAKAIDDKLKRIEKYFPSYGTIASNTERIAQLQLDHASPAARLELSTVEIHQAALYLRHMKLQEAQTWASNALKFSRAELGARHPNVAKAWHLLAGALAESGQLDKADEAVRQDIAIAEQYAATDPSLLADATARAGRDYILQALLPDASAKQAAAAAQAAQQSLQKAAALYQKSAGVSPQLSSTLTNLGIAFTVLKQWDQAQDSLNQALAIARQTMGEQSLEVAKIDYYLADMQAKLANSLNDAASASRQRQSAIALLRQANAIFERNLLNSQQDPFLLLGYKKLGDIYKDAGDRQAAAQAYKIALNNGLEAAPNSPAIGQAFKELMALEPSAYNKLSQRVAQAQAAHAASQAPSRDNDIDKPIEDSNSDGTR